MQDKKQHLVFMWFQLPGHRFVIWQIYIPRGKRQIPWQELCSAQKNDNFCTIYPSFCGYFYNPHKYANCTNCWKLRWLLLCSRIWQSGRVISLVHSFGSCCVHALHLNGRRTTDILYKSLTALHKLNGFFSHPHLGGQESHRALQFLTEVFCPVKAA